ncbi:MAG: rhodanese-like domain-containing protein, partial [Planctomycetota bacterium]
AAGDNSETHHLVLDRPVNIPLAGPANKTGRAAGANMALDLMGAPDDDPRRLSLTGILGTAIVRVGQAAGGCTGLTEAAAVKEGLAYAVTYMPGPSHAGYYPGAKPMMLKVLFDPTTGGLLGGQAVGGIGVDKRIDVLAVAITAGMTIDDLEQLDLAYAPPFGSAKDVTILAGFAGANTRRDVMPAITPAQLLDELSGDSPPVVVDVRTAAERAAGHLDGALHIPVDDLRGRIDDLPKGRALAVHCAGGYRSYLAQRILMNRGFDSVRNVLGGWTMIQRTQAARASTKE